MATLLLIRHALTAWNLDKRLTGNANPPLCSEGLNQVQEVARKVKNYTPDYIFTSEKKRTLETAEHIAIENGWKCKVKSSSYLNEQNFGLIEGLKIPDLIKTHGEKNIQLWRRSFSGRPPGGESLEEVQKRVIRFYKRSVVPKLKKNQNIVVVGHGNALRSLCSYLLNLDVNEIQHFEIKNGEPILFKFDHNLECKEWIKDYVEPEFENISH